MTTLLENPMPIIFFGIVVEIILGILLYTTRRGVLLAPMGGVLLLVLIGVVVERLVVTEREEVEAAICQGAAAIQSNDANRIGKFIANSPKGKEVRSRVNFYLTLVEIETISISGLEIGKINKLTSPPSVEVRFFGMTRYKDRTGTLPYLNYAANFVATMVREPDGWKVEEVAGDPNRPLTGGQGGR